MNNRNKHISLKNKIILSFTVFIILFLSLILLSNVWVKQIAKSRLYNSIESVPFNNVALLLGTSKYNSSGNPNLFFKYRIEAVTALFHTGKIKHIIVSGDNKEMSYNEPRDMRKALLANQIPDSCITLDYAGFRTLDSVVRCKKVFGQNKVTIVSQRFHLERALFIAHKYDMDAIGFIAEDAPQQYGIYTYIREYFAKFLAVIDLYILHASPKFLGDPIEIKVK
ncbi:MAG: vancomycin high temperature exclusion protein [Bacteroidia bacterium]